MIERDCDGCGHPYDESQVRFNTVAFFGAHFCGDCLKHYLKDNGDGLLWLGLVLPYNEAQAVQIGQIRAESAREAIEVLSYQLVCDHPKTKLFVTTYDDTKPIVTMARFVRDLDYP